MICPLHSSALFRHAEKVRTGCRGETVHTQTFCRQFLIRNSVIFDVENFSPNRPGSSGACESPFKPGISVGVPECRVSGWCPCHLSSLATLLSRSVSGCFPPDGIARFYLASTASFLFDTGGMRSFSMQTEWQCLLLEQRRRGADDGCFFGMPEHSQFNDWTVADGLLQFCTCTLLMSQQTSTFLLPSSSQIYLSMSLCGRYGWNNECKFEIDFIL